jgi:glucans biosynthesis protein C
MLRIHFLFNNRLLFMLLIFISAAAYYATHRWVIPTDIGFMPDPKLLLYYGCFFILGWLLRQQKSFLLVIQKYGWCMIIIGLISFFAYQLSLSDFSHGNTANSWLAAIFGTLISWSMIISLISLCFHGLNHNNKFSCYLADATYWIYLSQLLPIIFLQKYFIGTGFNPLIQYLLVCLLALVICLLSYQVFVRHTWISRMLRGGKVNVY